jgi:hypothetical protein
MRPRRRSPLPYVRALAFVVFCVFAYIVAAGFGLVPRDVRRFPAFVLGFLNV